MYEDILQAIEMLNKAVEQLDKEELTKSIIQMTKEKEFKIEDFEVEYLKQLNSYTLSEEIERYKPSKEELSKSIIQTIKEFEEGRFICIPPPVRCRLPETLNIIKELYRQ